MTKWGQTVTDDTVDVKQSGFGWQSKGQGFESPQLHSRDGTNSQQVIPGQALCEASAVDLRMID